MTKEEILAMKAGRELNIKVVEDVMEGKFFEDEIFGDTEFMRRFGSEMGAHCLEAPFYGPLRHYSEDMSDTQWVVDKLKSYDVRLGFNHNTEMWEAEFSKRGADFSYPVAVAPIAPEAICKAALLTMLEVRR